MKLCENASVSTKDDGQNYGFENRHYGWRMMKLRARLTRGVGGWAPFWGQTELILQLFLHMRRMAAWVSAVNR